MIAEGTAMDIYNSADSVGTFLLRPFKFALLYVKCIGRALMHKFSYAIAHFGQVLSICYRRAWNGSGDSQDANSNDKSALKNALKAKRRNNWTVLDNNEWL